MIYEILLYTEIFILVFANMALKKGSETIKEHNLRNIIKIIRIFLRNKYIIIGFLLYGISVLIWLIVLTKLDLSYAYPITSVSYVLVTLGSIFFLKEKVSKLRWFAIALVTIGVIFVSIS